jgi:DNA ligase-1
MPHIAKQLGYVMRPGTRTDGELYVPGIGFQEVIKLVKNPLSTKTQRTLGYYIYDIPSDQPWLERKKKLENLGDRIESMGCKRLHILETATATSWNQLVAMKNDAKARGFEGLIIRDQQATYQHRRTHFLLKLKDFIDAEYKVLDAEGGKGKNKDAVRWLCQVRKGKTMFAVHKCSQAERKEFLKNKEQYIGRMLTVQFFEYSQDGVPRFPVGLRFRSKGD